MEHEEKSHGRSVHRADRPHFGRSRHPRGRRRHRHVQVAVPRLIRVDTPRSPDGPAFEAIVARLRAAGCVFAEDEAGLLLAEAEAATVGPADPSMLERMIERRVQGYPLEHILGWAEFAGHRVRVDDRVFVPRRRTEFLASVAMSLASETNAPTVLDLCCGSGAIAVAVQSSIPLAELYAADIDPAAVRNARHNLRHPERVFGGDLFEPLPTDLRGRFDVIVANSPYVPTEALELMPPEARLHEARLALDGGGDGLDLQRRIATEAPRWLAPGGSLLTEVNEAQAAAAVAAFEQAGLDARTLDSDEYEVTVVIGGLSDRFLQHFSGTGGF